MKVPQVLVVDDEPGMVRLVSLYLQQAGFDVSTAVCGADALEAVQRRSPDLVVLDIGLPDMDGYAVCRQIRWSTETPIIMLTARGEHRDRIDGFKHGADDYVPKPFHPDELVARVRAVLRRAGHPGDTPGRYAAGGLVVDTGVRIASLDGQPLDLRPKELDLLATLMSQPGRVFSREALLQSVWGQDRAGGTATVDVHVWRLRSKLGETGKRARFIQTVWGIGYRFRASGHGA